MSKLRDLGGQTYRQTDRQMIWCKQDYNRGNGQKYQVPIITRKEITPKGELKIIPMKEIGNINIIYQNNPCNGIVCKCTQTEE